jgi:hypothetical protein
MHITIEHHSGKYPSFNVSLHKSAGLEAFLVIKGVKIVDGAKGEFLSWPARKLDSGKYWNHCWASDAFAAHIMQLAKDTLPKDVPTGRPVRGGRVVDDDFEAPF